MPDGPAKSKQEASTAEDDLGYVEESLRLARRRRFQIARIADPLPSDDLDFRFGAIPDGGSSGTDGGTSRSRDSDMEGLAGRATVEWSSVAGHDCL